MLAAQENRFQYVYFTLSGLVACTMLILFYISMRTTIVSVCECVCVRFSVLGLYLSLWCSLSLQNERLRDDLKLLQRQLIYERPNPHWNYNNSWRRIGNASLRHEIFSAYFDVRTDIISELV